MLSSIDISYERIQNKYGSFGVSLFYNFNSIDNDLYFPKKFSLTPYYRWLFSESKLARGFFVEGFGMLNTYKEEIYTNYNYDYYPAYTSEINQETDVALGISIGGKFVTKAGFVAEVFAGVGRNLFKTKNQFFDNNIVTRGGISIGYRF